MYVCMSITLCVVISHTNVCMYCIVFIYVCMYVCMCITEGVVISPMSGVLKGNESVTLMIAFSPVKVSLVTMYVCMYVTVCIYNVSHNLLFQSELHEYKLTFSTYPVGGKRICMYYVCVTYLSMCFFKCECVCMYVCMCVYSGRTKKVIDANQPGPVDPPELLQNFSVKIVAQGGRHHTYIYIYIHTYTYIYIQYIFTFIQSIFHTYTYIYVNI